MKPFLISLRNVDGSLLHAATTSAADSDTLEGLARTYLDGLPAPFASYELAHQGQLHHQLAQQFVVQFGPFSATLTVELLRAATIPAANDDPEPSPEAPE
jgi:hypothetical protein